MFTLKEITLIHDEIYSNWVFSHNHPTQGRRFQNAHDLLVNDPDLSLNVIKPMDIDKSVLLSVHEAGYVDEVVEKGLSGEWDGLFWFLAEKGYWAVGAINLHGAFSFF